MKRGVASVEAPIVSCEVVSAMVTTGSPDVYWQAGMNCAGTHGAMKSKYHGIKTASSLRRMEWIEHGGVERVKTRCAAEKEVDAVCFRPQGIVFTGLLMGISAILRYLTCIANTEYIHDGLDCPRVLVDIR